MLENYEIQGAEQTTRNVKTSSLTKSVLVLRERNWYYFRELTMSDSSSSILKAGEVYMGK